MPVSIGWPEIAVRLALAVLAGALLGLNRTQRGMTAGLRTTLLVCLAAASMLQVNLLLGVAGRPPDSFIRMDLMRLPLGILTGMGFIGAGAILRRGDLVTGVTTAATLWLATVLGLCFGGGQHGLGLAGLVLGLLVLWLLKGPEGRIRQERRALLVLAVGPDGPTDDDIRSALAAAGYQVASWDATYRNSDGVRKRKVRSQVQWQDRLPRSFASLRNVPESFPCGGRRESHSSAVFVHQVAEQFYRLGVGCPSPRAEDRSHPWGWGNGIRR